MNKIKSLIIGIACLCAVVIPSTTAAPTVSIKATWKPNPASDNVRLYTLYYRKADEKYALTKKESVNGMTYSLVLTNLVPRQKYIFFLRATNEKGTSGDSNKVTFTTPRIAR